MAGYTRLMGGDEEGTLAALTAHRTELIEPCIAEHRGRVVKTTGDGLLAEFASVVDAVRCAVAFQDGMRERSSDTPEDRRIQFRIGVNLGDVIVPRFLPRESEEFYVPSEQPPHHVRSSPNSRPPSANVLIRVVFVRFTPDSGRS